ncbi:hypothetical protein [Pedobacter sp.]|jgi:hypothetical protein|uniref:hypothetical protein n=1 Tax=Pedobacter sp. TaxID=1411316 RepID=UPI002CAEF8F9|nr:hypothetical protein [Pedobacter sp.]HWW39216.1 hypothetical protein [Pedobacter sp.]
MTQTFTINESLIGNILKRLAIRLIKIYTLVLIIITLPDIINPNKPFRTIGLSAGVVVAMMGFTMLLGYKKTRKMYSGYQITLDDKGIELKAPMAAYKRIDWSELAYVEKESGDIKAYDNTVSALSRWWTGTGVIFIPREINNKDQLLLSLVNHINN